MAVTWQQWVNSFDSTTVETGCSAVINTGAAFPDTNTLTSTIANATDTSDTAEGVITTHLPAGTEGRIRFKFKTPVTFNLLGNTTFFAVNNGTGEMLELFITSAELLELFVVSGPLTGTGGATSTGVTLAANTEYTIEVSWKQNSAVNVWVNEVQKVNFVCSGATGSGSTAKVILGIDHYDGSDSSGWSNVIRWGQIGDSATTALTDPTVATARTLALLGVGS